MDAVVYNLQSVCEPEPHGLGVYGRSTQMLDPVSSSDRGRGRVGGARESLAHVTVPAVASVP